MKSSIKLFVVLFSLGVLINSCKEDAAVPDMGYSYFPTDVGTYVVYDVDSTYYDDFYSPTKAFNYKFQLKEKIESVFKDNQNRSTVRLERYVKYYDSLVPYSAMSWKLRDVWMGNLNTTNAEKVEENVRYVRLVFPTRKSKKWDANVQNTIGEREFTYNYVDATESVGGIDFSHVLQTEYDDGGYILTNREYFTEKYARNVGMVYRQAINVESQPKAGASSAELQAFYAKPIMQRITKGYQYTMTVVAYGKE